MCVWFIKQHGPGVHIAGFPLKGHGFGLAGLMVLKGIVFGLFLPFFYWMVLKGGAVMTYGLQVSSSGSVGFVEVFFLFFLEFDETLPDLTYIDPFGWS